MTPQPSVAAGPRGLPALETALRRDLELLKYPARDWIARRTAPDGTSILDVAVVGGGQSGLAAAAALRLEKVPAIEVLDENPPDRAGPWLNFARMITLRTPKHLTGPDLGLPNLTIQAWFEAQHGDGSWQDIGLVPKETWAAYLSWYRRVLELPVRFHARVGTVRWEAALRAFALPVQVAPPGEPARTVTVLARRVVFATGIDGSGQWEVPPAVRDNLPRALWAHTRDDIDFPALRGKTVVVLGAGASAFDNASVALEHGAREVHLYFRRREMVRVNPYRWAEFVGFLKHLGDLPDGERWRFVHKLMELGQLPPADTYARATRHPNFHLHPGSPWQRIEAVGDRVQLTFPQGTVQADFLIVGTGFVTDLTRRPELAALAPHVALWEDRFTPPAGQEHADLARHPYLGPHFEFTEKHPGQAPWVSHAYNYTFGGLVSLGFGGASISGMKYSVPRLVAGITGSLFAEDCAQHFQNLCAFDEPEF